MTEPHEFQILSWNLLNDFEVPKHTAQVDRLPVLADQINRLILADVPTVAFFCEGTTSDRLIALAKDCGLVTVGQPSPYTDDDYMMFAVSPELLDLCSVEFLPFKHQANKFGVLRLMLGSQTIIGAHYPWRPIRDAFARSRATKDVLGHLPKDTPSLVMGDLNSMAWMSARRQLTAAGLHEIHAANKPLFPQSDFHGMTFPRIAPRVSIDAMYASTHYRESHLDYVLSPASDHPILSAVVNLPAN